MKIALVISMPEKEPVEFSDLITIKELIKK